MYIKDVGMGLPILPAHYHPYTYIRTAICKFSVFFYACVHVYEVNGLFA